MYASESCFVLKGFVFFTEVSDGIYFNGGFERNFVFQGRGLYPLISRILNALDGSRSIGQIILALPPQIRELANKLVVTLAEHELLVDMREANASLTPLDWQLYGNALSFLRDNDPDFVGTFDRWRHTPIIAAGAGQVFRVLLRSLARSGVRTIYVLHDGGRSDDEVDYLSPLELHRRKDDRFNFELAADLSDLAGVSGTRIVYGNDEIVPGAGSGILSSVLLEKDRGVMIGGILDGRGFVGPQSTQRCGLVDLANRIHRPADRLPYSLTTRSVIGSLLAHETMRVVCGLKRNHVSDDRAALRNWMMDVSPSGEILMHPLFPAPNGQGDRNGFDDAADPMPVGDLPNDRVPRPFEEWHSELITLFDPITGLFSREPGDTLMQLPLSHEAIEVHPPRWLGNDPFLVVGWGLTSSEAGCRAMKRAISAYAALFEGSTAPITAARSDEEWYASALAAALFADAELCQSCTIHSLDMVQMRTAAPRATHEADELRTAKTLLRLMELFEGDIVVSVARMGDRGPFGARVRAGSRVRFECGLSAVEAVIEALGAVCSGHQLNVKSDSPVPAIPDWDAVPIEGTLAWDDLLALKSSPEECIEWLTKQGYRADAIPFAGEQTFDPFPVAVGQVGLTRQ